MGTPDCTVCDGEGIAALGTGPATDLFPCPACRGLVRSELAGIYLEDAERACAAAGVEPRWKPPAGWLAIT